MPDTVKFQVGLDRSTKKITVINHGGVPPEGMVELGEFEVNTVDASGPKFNKVLYNEVAELMSATGIQNMAEYTISVTPEAYEAANGAFLPQDAKAYGTLPTPGVTSDENPNNSTQVDQANGKARKARRKPQVEAETGSAVDPASMETPPGNDPMEDPKPLDEGAKE